MLDRLFGNTIDVLEKGLDGNGARLRAIGTNIANADTPGYKRRQVFFEREMQQALGHGDSPALAVTQPGHLSVGPLGISQSRPLESIDSSSTMRNDGNNVDIDSELTNLAQTHMTYNALSELAKRKLEGLKSVIRDTR